MSAQQWCRCVLTAVLFSGLLTGFMAIQSNLATAQENGSIEVTDALERTVTFDEPPDRIVISGKAFFAIVDAMYMFPEARKRVVGMPGSYLQGHGDTSFLSLIDPAYDDDRDRVLLQGEASAEQIAPLQPDVVVLKSFMKGSLGDSLEGIGIPVVYLELESPEIYDHDFRTLGQLLDNAERADELAAYFNGRLATIQDRLSDVPESERPETLLVRYSKSGGAVSFVVTPPSWIQTRLVELAGGRPVWTSAVDSGGWSVVNFEQIAAWDPDRIVVADYGGDAADTVQKLKTQAKWRLLSAVQSNQIYGFPGDFYSWDMPDPRWALGLDWLAKTLHADRFAEIDVMDSVRGFFGDLYGLDKATIESSIFPQLSGSLPLETP